MFSSALQSWTCATSGQKLGSLGFPKNNHIGQNESISLSRLIHERKTVENQVEA